MDLALRNEERNLEELQRNLTGNEPQLQRIQNPAVRFRMDEDIFATGYIIPEENWSPLTNEQN